MIELVQEFFAIFGTSDMALLRKVYHSRLRPHLSELSATFWDKGIYVVQSFMYSGTAGVMSWVVVRIILPLFGLGFIRRELLKGTNNGKLQEMIASHGRSLRLMAWFLDNIMLRGVCCFSGVPDRQVELGAHRPNNLALVLERVLFRSNLAGDNYFYAAYLTGFYRPDNCPRYLQKEHFLTLRRHLQVGHSIRGKLTNHRHSHRTAT